MNFRDIVAAEYRKRLSNGQNRESANSFNFSDFPNIPKEDMIDFCDCGYATKQLRGFFLTRETMEDFESE